MKHPNASALRMLLAIAILTAAGCHDSKGGRSPSPTEPPVCQPGPFAGRLLVTFVPTTTEAEARAVVEGHGLQVLRVSLGFSAGLEHRWLLVGVPEGTERFWIRELAKSPLVTIVEQDSILCVD